MHAYAYVPLRELRRIRLRAEHDGTCASVAAFATLCRINVLYMIARAGSGHLGTSFSSLDLVSWLHLRVLRPPQGKQPGDVYFSSKGHDAPAYYAVMIAMERLPFDTLHRLRRLGGLPGHPDVRTMPIVVANTGSLGMGISKAKGLALADRLAGADARVYVLTGDGELQEGQIWESLQQAANLRLHRLTITVDRNRIQSDTWVAAVNDQGDLAAKFRAFGWHVVWCDGHDLASFAWALEAAARETTQPTVILADTVKGKGVSFMEGPAMVASDQMYRFHSGAPTTDQYERALNELVEHARAQLEALGLPPLQLEYVPRRAKRSESGTQQLVSAYSRALVRLAERHERVVVLDADLVRDCGLVAVRDRFPDRFIECGIAEQDMVSMAGGLAARGWLPIVHSFACFLSARPNEQIYNNATEGRKVVYVGSLAGLLPAGPGHSHQGVRDISALAAIPGLVLMEPSCEHEVDLALEYCADGTDESVYLRLVSVGCEIPFELPPDYQLSEGRGVMLREGRDAIVIGAGPIVLTEACRAIDRLRIEHGLRFGLVNLPWLNRLDRRWLRELVADCPLVFTLDNHYTTGGQGQMVLAALAESDGNKSRRAMALGLMRVPLCGGNEEVLRAHGLDAAALYTVFRDAMSAGSSATMPSHSFQPDGC